MAHEAGWHSAGVAITPLSHLSVPLLVGRYPASHVMRFDSPDASESFHGSTFCALGGTATLAHEAGWHSAGVTITPLSHLSLPWFTSEYPASHVMRLDSPDASESFHGSTFRPLDGTRTSTHEAGRHSADGETIAPLSHVSLPKLLGSYPASHVMVLDSPDLSESFHGSTFCA